MKKFKLSILLAVLLSAYSPALCQDDVPFQKKLDTSIKVKLDDKPIAIVLGKLEKASGVKIKLSPKVTKLLPYGSDTRLTVNIEGYTLRQALPAVLGSQGLTWEIDGNAVLVKPHPALSRLCRRATFKDISLLGELITTKIPPMKNLALTPRDVIQNALKKSALVKSKKILVSLPAGLEQIQRNINCMRKANQALPGSLADWLDMYCLAENLTWYVDGNTIHILSRKAQIKRQLDKKITLDLKRAKLIDVLFKLAAQAEVKMTLAPGVIAMLSDDVKNNFTIALEKAAISQVLEYIQGVTGLEFELTDQGVSVKPSRYLAKAKAGTARGLDPNMFLQVKIKTASGAEITLYILPDQLPDSVRKALEKKRKKYIDDLIKSFKDGGV